MFIEMIHIITDVFCLQTYSSTSFLLYRQDPIPMGLCGVSWDNVVENKSVFELAAIP